MKKPLSALYLILFGVIAVVQNAMIFTLIAQVQMERSNSETNRKYAQWYQDRIQRLESRERDRKKQESMRLVRGPRA